MNASVPISSPAKCLSNKRESVGRAMMIMQALICIAWLIVVWVKRMNIFCRVEEPNPLKKRESGDEISEASQIKIHSHLPWWNISNSCGSEEKAASSRKQCASADLNVDWIKSVSVTHTSPARNENENWKWRTQDCLELFEFPFHVTWKGSASFKVVLLFTTVEMFFISFFLVIELSSSTSSWQMLDDFRKYLCKWYSHLLSLSTFFFID